MGLTSSPGAFMRLVDSALRGLPPGICLPYMDDILVPTAGTFDDHLKDVGMVFDALIEAGFTVRCDKVHVAMREVPYLGFIVGAYGTRPQPAKTKALLDMVCEAMGYDAAAAARYAGMIGYFHKFIRNLHVILSPFHQLKAKGSDVVEIMSSLRFKAAFAASNHALATATALARPDMTKPFIVTIDSAAGMGTGGALTQRQTSDGPPQTSTWDHDEVPLAFRSRRFNDGERRMGARDHELLGLYEAVSDWRVYLLGAITYCRTDHKSLQWLLNTSHKDGSRAASWASELQSYDLRIGYSPGDSPEIGVPDCLSRHPIPAGESGGDLGLHADRPDIRTRLEQSLEFTHPNTATVNLSDVSPRSFNRLRAAALRFDCVAALIICIRDGSPCVLVESHNGQIALPCVTFPQSTSSSQQTYRSRLQQYFTRAYDPDSSLILLSSISTATKHRVTSSTADSINCVCFAACIPDGLLDNVLHSEDGCSCYFVDLSSALASTTPHHPTNAALLLSLYRSFYQDTGAFCVTPSFKKLASLSKPKPASTAIVATTSNTHPPTPSPLPSIELTPLGPAFCTSSADIRLAFSHLWNYLDSHPNCTISIDLEGNLGGPYSYISTIQVAVGTSTDPQQCVYVLDTHLNGDTVFEIGSRTLRAALESTAFVKVLHCCYGDASSMFYTHHVCLQNVFDTGLADCVLRECHFNKPRNLGLVVSDYLGDSVNLSQKGQLVHIPHMFNQRPLPLHLFTYSFEDVLYCNELGEQLMSFLAKQGLLDLVFVLSQQRSPPAALPPTHPSFQPTTSVAFALCDSTSVICLCHRTSGLHSLPSLPITAIPDDVPRGKPMARYLWTTCMGPPPKKARAAVNAHVRKADRVGDTSLFKSVVADVASLLNDLASVFAASPLARDFVVTLRPLCQSSFPSSGTAADQSVLFQYLHCVALRRQPSRSAPSAYSVVTTSTPAPYTQLCFDITDDTVLVSFNICLNPSPVSASNVVLGKTSTGIRASLILYDSTNVYVLTSGTPGEPSSPYTFPSAVVEIGSTPREAAVRAFDIYLGTSLRKKSDSATANAYSTFPVSSHFFADALEHITPVFKDEQPHGNNIYFSCFLPHCTALGFHLSMHSSRRPHHFNLLPSFNTKTPGFRWCSWSDAESNISNKYDLGAFANVYDSLQNHKPGDDPQPSDPSRSFTAQASPLDSPTEPSSHETPRDPQPSDPSRALALADSLPAIGVDSDFDDLFEACALVTFSRLIRQTASSFTSSSGDGVGTPLKEPPLTRRDVANEQRKHPATSSLVEYLLNPSLYEFNQDDTADDIASFQQLASRHRLSRDGLLLQRKQGSEPADLIVIPPRFVRQLLVLYHDRLGHVGVRKVVEHLKRRFTCHRLEKDVREHIRLCEPCTRAKVDRHSAGEMQIGWEGDHPHDVCSVDHYSVGIKSGESGFDGVLDFVCHFSRHITAEPTVGTPTSEEVANIIVRRIIRQFGVPRQLRSDQGSNLVSAAIKSLYSLYGIQMADGVAYRHLIVALLERWHATLKTLLNVHRVATGDDDWHLYLPFLEICFNAAVSAALGYSPFFIVHLREAVLPSDVLREPPSTNEPLVDWVAAHLERRQIAYDAVNQTLLKNSLHAKKKWDLRHDVHTHFHPGQLVLLYKGSVVDKGAVHPKATIPTEGPFTILRALSRDRYVLTDLHTRRIHDTVHVSRLKLHPNSSSALSTNDSVKWPVRAIVGRRVSTQHDANFPELGKSPRIQYKVRWTGFDKSYDSWRSEEYLHDVKELVDAFNSTHAKPPDNPPVSRSPRAIDTVTLPPLPSPSRRHFRHRPTPLPSAESSAPAPSPAATDYDYLSQPISESTPHFAPVPEDSPLVQLPATNDLTDRFPRGSRVRVQYRDGSWYTGTVIKSYITKPTASTNRLPDRAIVVDYDDKRYTKPYLHELAGSTVELIQSTDPSPPPTTSREDRLLRRRARLDAELSNST